MESIWQNTAKLRKFPTLEGDTCADVCVIGGGMAGLLTAYKLRGQGYKTVVVEANEIASGATAFTTGKITALHGLIYSRIVRDYGTETAKLYAAANQRAISDYEQIIADKGIECEFLKLPHYVYSMKSDTALKEELEAMEKAGLKGEFVKETELPLPIAGAVGLLNQACFNPLKFIEGITDDFEIYENTRALSLEDGRVITEHGAIDAGYVIVATHYPFINTPGWYFARMHQERSYLTALQKAPILSAMYIDEDPNGMTFRPYTDQLIMGIGNHRTGENTSGGYYNELNEACKRLYPQAAQIQKWSNQDCMTPDAIPFIGCYSKSTPDMYVATGFNQWGMSGSMVAAELIKREICGEDNPELEAFSPRRFKMKAMKSGLKEHMKTSVSGLWEGAYPEPAKHRCSHMGCALSRNADDVTWECACHGSRFNDDGSVLNGPAQKPFELNPDSKNTGK